MTEDNPVRRAIQALVRDLLSEIPEIRKEAADAARVPDGTITDADVEMELRDEMTRIVRARFGHAAYHPYEMARMIRHLTDEEFARLPRALEATNFGCGRYRNLLAAVDAVVSGRV